MNRLRLQAQGVSQQLPSSSSSAPPPPPSSSFSPLSSSSSSSSSCSPSSIYTHYTNQSNLSNTSLCRQDNQNFPESWSQLLLDGLVEEKGKEEEDDDRISSSSFTPHFQPSRLVENWKDQVLYSSPNTNIVGPKQESYESGYMYNQSKIDQGIQITMSSPFWSHALHASSISSCATTSLNSSSSSSMLDISKNKPEGNNLPVEKSSECNSTTGSALKKARVQISSISQPTIKVRKEKLGDRITALHQLVSPFGKTDTASVLQEAIGYIRFLHHQIEALFLPYLVDGSKNSRPLEKDDRNDVSQEDHFQDQDACDEPKKDLGSKGLCLVPISLILHVERDKKASYWALGN